ncbi:LysR substrate-binding domain-containing protein [Paracoccus cavernae]|uniref:LysR substrate-binding domain-containing protein n=1 Tax=Paracoccus cavernae TaxID=1571207 RepID=A0ABT8D9P9_9RHOB|nr:LysR substrate-binding domain-containing protein [Paracoccus cavernae]
MTVRPYLERAELAALHEPQITASVSNMEAQAVLIRSGCFLGFLPVHFAQKWVDRGEMRALDAPGLLWKSQFYIALRVQPEPTEVARLFARDLAEVLVQRPRPRAGRAGAQAGTRLSSANLSARRAACTSGSGSSPAARSARV